MRYVAVLALAVVVAVVLLPAGQSDDAYTPKRINKVVELLAEDQPVYYTRIIGGGYEEGKELAQTWADFLVYDLEQNPFNMDNLRAFMQGLVDGGPTKSGHRTPAVVVVPPFGGIDDRVMWANYWMIEHILATGAHGILLAHARSPEVVQTLVQAARYPHSNPQVADIKEGLRGHGGQAFAASIWGVSEVEYRRLADPWPLNPNGEIIIGLKIEDRHALENAEATASVPGVTFAEWGTADMSISFNMPDGRGVDVLPKVLADARTRVFAATQQAGVRFLDGMSRDNIEQRIDEGVRIGGSGSEIADHGRRYTNRQMPW
jgi:4-hydroxy-2-oxoheptanedioate aldolase